MAEIVETEGITSYSSGIEICNWRFFIEIHALQTKKHAMMDGVILLLLIICIYSLLNTAQSLKPFSDARYVAIPKAMLEYVASSELSFTADSSNDVSSNTTGTAQTDCEKEAIQHMDANDPSIVCNSCGKSEHEMQTCWSTGFRKHRQRRVQSSNTFASPNNPHASGPIHCSRC